MFKRSYFIPAFLFLISASVPNSYTQQDTDTNTYTQQSTDFQLDQETSSYFEQAQAYIKKWLDVAPDTSDFSTEEDLENEVKYLSSCYWPQKIWPKPEHPVYGDYDECPSMRLIDGNYFDEELPELSVQTLKDYKDACLRVIRETYKVKEIGKWTNRSYTSASALSFIIALYQLSRLSTSSYRALAGTSFFALLSTVLAGVGYDLKRAREDQHANKLDDLRLLLKVLERAIQELEYEDAQVSM